MINHPAGRPVQPSTEDPAGLAGIGARAVRAGGPAGGPGRRWPGRGRARAARLLVLLAAFVCAACGLVYELELVALGGHLIGDPMTQTSVVLSVMVFAMGVGSLAAKRLTRRPATSFALVECALALTGGLSVLLLYSAWAWLDRYGVTTAGVVGTTFLIGVLIGAEIPLLMTLIQRIRREDAGRAAADLFAADYVGALIGGLAFPFLLLPLLGQTTGALVTGAVNAVAGAAVVLWLFRDEPSPRTRLLLWAGCGLVLVVLAVAAAFTGVIERAARNALYGAQVRLAIQSRHQEIVLAGSATGAPDTAESTTGAESAPRVPPQRSAPLELFLNGRLALCGPDEYREHEALVHPALGSGPVGRVLLLGGGDGMALREVLGRAAVRDVTVVELDPAVPELVRRDAALSALSRHSLEDARVRLVTAEPLHWLRSAGSYDVVLSTLRGLPYDSREFYGLAARALAPGGRLVVRTDTVWSTEATVRAVGLHTVPYAAADGPRSCPAGPGGPETFVLAARTPPQLVLTAPTRSLTTETLLGAADRLAAQRPERVPEPRGLLD
ncbi:spermidine synthase [Kitasatospora sp. NPDC101801]|uniref:spermine/spermidine synthase domain-containing protein n=1 Tax=Kitasatospora sp. NPDC101801 TaxID=3364103 RepID=UPI00382CE7D8